MNETVDAAAETMDAMNKHHKLNDAFAAIRGDRNIWMEMTHLVEHHGAVNLGQGFPNYSSLPYLNERIAETLADGGPLMHQYTRSSGHVRLVNAIAALYSELLGRSIDPMNEVLVTVGATGSLCNAFTSFFNADDEVILIEPFFDSYAPLTALSGGKCVCVPLRPTEQDGATLTSANFKWDDAELEAAFTPRTKLIVINTPNNPLGKVFSRRELEQVAALCIRHNVLCLADEVYEFTTFEREHTRIASLPGMWERTITVTGATKILSSTGIKIGWSYGPKELIKLCQVAHQNTIYCCPTFMQEVVARCLEFELSRLHSPDCYFRTVRAELQMKRDYLAAALRKAGLQPIVPEAGFFIVADISPLVNDDTFVTDDAGSKDYKFAKHMTSNKKLAPIPMSCFYSEEHKRNGENFIRFCYFKDDNTLERAVKILENFSDQK